MCDKDTEVGCLEEDVAVCEVSVSSVVEGNIVAVMWDRIAAATNTDPELEAIRVPRVQGGDGQVGR